METEMNSLLTILYGAKFPSSYSLSDSPVICVCRQAYPCMHTHAYMHTLTHPYPHKVKKPVELRIRLK